MDYTAPDKVDGSTWTAPEHNALKAAVNSKLDKSSLINTAPGSGTTVYTSGYVDSLVDTLNSFKRKGIIPVTDNLFTKTEHGYYVIDAEEIPSSNPSYPAFPGVNDYRWGGSLIVTGKDDLVNFMLVLNGSAAGSGSPSRVFVNFSLDGGDTFDGWQEFPSVEWLSNNFLQIMPDGLPNVTNTGGLTLDTTNCFDLRGFISVVNNTGSALGAGVNIQFTFQHMRNGIRSVVLESYVGNSPGFKAVPYSIPSSSGFTIRIDEGLPDGEGGSFFYQLQ